MAEAIRVITIEHEPAIHEIRPAPRRSEPELTLLELVTAVSEVSDSEQEVLATVSYMLRSGRIRLASDDPSD